MGAVVAYEIIKRMEGECSPNKPVALIVSGCPAPHLFPEEYKSDAFDWLSKLRTPNDFERLSEEQISELQQEFGFGLEGDFPDEDMRWLTQKTDTAGVGEFFKLNKRPAKLDVARSSVINDLELLKNYKSWSRSK